MNSSKLKVNYLPELSAFLFGRKRPSMVSVNLTDRCNQKCIYCEIGQEGFSPEPEINKLTKDDLFWIIDQMEITKVKRLSMCGGEPFLFQYIADVVEYAWKKKIRCNITSNGMTIHDLDLKVLELFFKCNTQINISIDSFNNPVQSKIRGSGVALENALKSLEVLQKHKIQVTILCAISRYNYNDLFETFVTACKLGVREVLYQPIISSSNYPEIQAIKNKHLLNVEPDKLGILNNQLEKICQYEKRHRINSNVYRIKPWINEYIESALGEDRVWFFYKILKKFYCREVYAVIEINYSGGIQACGLAEAEINIKDNKETDLYTQWLAATSGLRHDLGCMNYPVFCNGCCHKFGRNMLASIMKYPITNRKALYSFSLLLFARIIVKLYKKFIPGFK